MIECLEDKQNKRLFTTVFPLLPTYLFLLGFHNLINGQKRRTVLFNFSVKY